MSLTNALYFSFAGLRQSEAQLSVSSSNITNADKPGYTRKEYTSDYATTSAGTIPVGGSIEHVVVNDYLLSSIIDDTSTAAGSKIMSDYLNRYADALGTTDGGDTLSAAMNDLAAALDQLAVTPEDSSLKSLVVSKAKDVAYQMRQLSDTVQQLRDDADSQIGATVDDINAGLKKIEKLNEEISLASATGRSTADLEDERNTAVEDLSKKIKIDYFVDSNNQLKIYTGGRPILDSKAHTLNFTEASNVSSTATYPGGLSGITVDGNDITGNIHGGELGALLDLRDNTLVNEQSKLDELANTTMSTLNSLLNQGSSLPPRSSMTGDTSGLAAGDPLGGTGTVRIATIDNNGTVTHVGTFNLAGYATIGDMITDINATLGPDVSASLSTNGELNLVANNSGEGLAIAQQTSSVGANSDDFSTYFGLNNMFYGTGADNIRVSDYLQTGSEYLATSALDPLANIGTTGVSPGNGSIAQSMNNAFTTATSFSAAGDFAAQNETLSNYTNKLISSVATKASNASSSADMHQSLLDQTKSSLENLVGVNIDEEMANITQLQAKYQSAATLIGTLQNLFDELIAAVR